MRIDTDVKRIIEAAQDGSPPTKGDCTHLLGFPETTIEASTMRAVADAVSRQRFNNAGMLLGQIGIEIAPCPGKCKFCSFGEEHTDFESSMLSDDDILARGRNFTASGELYALFLMTMHAFDFSRLLHILGIVREAIPQETQIVVNIGDFDRARAVDLKAAGVDGAYHVCRLREGEHTSLPPQQRLETIQAIKDSGLDWYNCCEPIGPEHTAEEVSEQIFSGIEYGCFQHAVMRRTYIKSSSLAAQGQITELRLAQVAAVVTLASLACPETQSIAVHEPNLLGLASGANTVYAETGANPRDTQEDTTGNRGRNIAACKEMLYEAGFSSLQVSPERLVSLTEAFL